MEYLKVTDISMDYNRKQFKKEIDDILESIKKQKIFSGKVNGHITVVFNEIIPPSYNFLHLNRALTGIFTQKMTQEGSKHIFNFSNTSIYKFLQELEYLRAYSKYKKLEILNIEIRISNKFNKKEFVDMDSVDFKNFYKIELSDIMNSLEISRLFTGSISVKYKLINGSLDDSEIDLRSYSSIYKLFGELENLKKNINRTNIRLIISLSELNSSNVKIRENLFKRRDEEAIKK